MSTIAKLGSPTEKNKVERENVFNPEIPLTGCGRFSLVREGLAKIEPKMVKKKNKSDSRNRAESYKNAGCLIKETAVVPRAICGDIETPEVNVGFAPA